MELVERVQNFKRNLDNADDPNVPWYRRKRTYLLAIIVFLVLVGVLVLFFGGYFAGLSAYKESEGKEEDIPDPEPRVLPPLEWDGVCPKKADKCPSSFKGIPPLILVSLDGFHPDFMGRGFTPTIKNIATCGTHTPYMFPVFPSKTFPNHFSQVTGLNPPTHGIIDNNIYDPIKKKLFKVGTPESLQPYWWLKEPIWVTAQKQGKKSACYYWPGSEMKINDTLPTYYKKYNSKVSFNSRVDQVLKWLDLPPEARPNFLTLYVNEPDHALHYFGTKSKQVNEALGKVDRMIERLFSGLQLRYLIDCVNVIIVSDHGMSDTDCKRVMELQNFINVNETYNTVGPFGRIRPKGRINTTAVDELVNKLRCKNSHMRVYPKEQLPVRYHYADSNRIEPVFVDIDAGWTVVSKLFKPDDGICSGGAHGYDNTFPDMRAIFLAHGPAFKKNFTMQPFINTELYEMMSELIGISPNPNNGTRGSMHYIMTSPHLLPPKQEQPPSPAVAKVPSDDDEYNGRIMASHCSCPQAEKQTEMQNIDAAGEFHFPFGIPYDAEDHSSLQLLYNEDYVSAFSLKFRIPMWSAFTLKEENEYKKLDIDCWTADARIPRDNVPKCDEYDILHENDLFIIQQPLFPPGFSGFAAEQASFITNSIAKSQNYSKILEEPFNQILRRWASESGKLNVIIGPAFNIFATGVRPSSEDLMKMSEKNGPVLIPTHMFAILTWCSEKSNSLQSCDTSKLKAHAFLLPNQPFPMNCDPPKDVIVKNSARVVDVEKLTGLSFYTNLPVYDAIRLRTMMPERTL